VSVALVLCLNVGVDPPDVVKPEPCARLECWLNPLGIPPQKALDAIGKTLQSQYMRWQPRARYKLCCDPCVEDVKKLCINLRRTAKDERVLFHYNGHGVPRPTKNGEIWVFNKNYTQYIPLSIYDLQTWMGSPAIYVFDCSSAGIIINVFKQFALQREREEKRNAASASASASSSRPAASAEDAAAGGGSSPSSSFMNSILLAACSEDEVLPTNPDFPADLFTSCLTTPIKTALHWFAPRSLIQGITFDMIDRIPGVLNDRKTPLGELNWVFTAITDTIAWNVFQRDLFKKLFRQDLLVASLFRNFLLAERIMWTANCTPVTEPKLPPTHDHPLWQAWDYTVEHCLAQLPAMLAAEDAAIARSKQSDATAQGGIYSDGSGYPPPSPGGLMDPTDFQYAHNPFFEDHMTAFEVWLSLGPQQKKVPEQLPIVMQVLLSQSHRLRALKLLASFLQTGPWAVDVALSMGIFPYVLKLLQSPTLELRQELIFIWGKILALDKSCEADIVKENGHSYFINFLASQGGGAVYLAMAAFTVSKIIFSIPEKCIDAGIIPACSGKLDHEEALVRLWVCLCLSRLAECSLAGSFEIIREPSALANILILAQSDDCSEVRASAISILGSLLFHFMSTMNEEQKVMESAMGSVPGSFDPQSLGDQVYYSPSFRDHKMKETQAAKPVGAQLPPKDNMLIISSMNSISKALSAIFDSDSSPLVRREIAIAFSRLADGYPQEFVGMLTLDDTSSLSKDAKNQKELLLMFWNQLVQLSEDPHPVISAIAFEATNNIWNVVSGGSSQQVPIAQLNKRITELNGNSNLVRGASVPKALNQKNPRELSIPSFIMYITESNGDPRAFSFDTLSDAFRNLNGRNLQSPSASVQSSMSVSAYKPMDFQSLYDWCCSHILDLYCELTEDQSKEEEARSKNPFLRMNCGHNMFYPPEENDKEISSIREVASNNISSGELWSLSFIPKKPQIAVGDSLGNVGIWNFQTWEQDASFTIPTTDSEPPGVTSIHIIDSHVDTPLVAAGAGGTVALWRRADKKCKNNSILNVWQTSGSYGGYTNTSEGHGFTMSYNAENNYLVTGGCERGLVKIWDLSSEMCVWHGDVLRKGCVVTALEDVKRPMTNTYAVGSTDGAIVLVDARVPSSDENAHGGGVLSFEEHSSAIVSVGRQMSVGEEEKLVSASLAGDIRIWDLRFPSNGSLQVIQAHRSEITAITVSEKLPMIASGSSNGSIKLFGSAGRLLKVIQYHEGFLGTRMAPVTSLAIHPESKILAAGCADSVISLYH